MTGSEASTTGQGEQKTQYGPDAIIPGRVLDNGSFLEVPPAAQLIYVIIRRHANKAGISQMTLKGLQARARVSRKTLFKSLADLERERLILKRQKMSDVSMAILRKAAPPNTWFFWTDPMRWNT